MIARVPAFIERIVVVDDASTDETSAVVAALSDPRIELVREERNQGVGGAVIDGYRHALDLGCESRSRSTPTDRWTRATWSG